MVPFRRLWLNVGQNGVNLNRMFRNISETIDKYIYWIKFDTINSISWSRVLSAGCTSDVHPSITIHRATSITGCTSDGLCRQRGHWQGWFIDDHQINSNPFNNYNKLQTDKWTGQENRKDMVMLCCVVFYYSDSMHLVNPEPLPFPKQSGGLTCTHVYTLR